MATVAALLSTSLTVDVDAFAPSRNTRSSTKCFSTIESSSTTSSASSQVTFSAPTPIPTPTLEPIPLPTKPDSNSEDIPTFVTEFLAHPKDCFINFCDPDDSVNHCDCLSEADLSNVPPSLSILMSSLSALRYGRNIRGPYVPHVASAGTVLDVSKAVRSYLKERRKKYRKKAYDDITMEQQQDAWIKWADENANIPGAALSPFASYCLGASFAAMVKEQQRFACNDQNRATTICIANDEFSHEERLADSFARGADSVKDVTVQYAGVASVPAMNEYSRSGKCDATVVVAALKEVSEDTNELVFNTAMNGEFTKADIGRLIEGALVEVRMWYDRGLLPPSSGYHGVYRTETVDCMAHYERILKDQLGP